MQQQSQTLSISTHGQLRVLPVKDVTVVLMAMPISEEQDGYWVELERVSNVRTLISTIHRFTDMRFKTTKADRGITIWRKA